MRKNRIIDAEFYVVGSSPKRDNRISAHTASNYWYRFCAFIFIFTALFMLLGLMSIVFDFVMWSYK